METAEEYLSIDTPENVVFGYEVAGIGSRFLAALVDTLIVFVLQLIVFLTGLFLVDLLFGSPADWESAALAWLIGALGLLAFAFQSGYYVFFEMTWNGQSPGKRWVGLRVIRTDGTPITFAESLVRNLVRVVDFLPAYYGIGIVTMFIDRRSRRLGDLTAGTLVVRDRPDVTLESLRAKPSHVVSAPSSSVPPLDLPVERLTSQDIQLAEDFLHRRHGFPNPTAAAVARRIAHALLERMEVSESQLGLLSSEDVIREIVQASRRPETGEDRP